MSLASEPPAPGAECVTAGWGTQTTSGLFMTSILQKLPASILDREECITVSNALTLYGHDYVTEVR